MCESDNHVFEEEHGFVVFVSIESEASLIDKRVDADSRPYPCSCNTSSPKNKKIVSKARRCNSR